MALDRDALAARVTRYGWLPLVALASTVALESGERQSLSQAVDGIQHRFHVSNSAVGWLPFAMAIVGVLGAFPVGILADRLRRTWLLAWAVGIWTACMGLNGLATSYACRSRGGATRTPSSRRTWPWSSPAGRTWPTWPR